MIDEDSIPYRDGWFAHKLGVKNPDENPYKVRRQSVSHHYWLAGWSKRFECVKHDKQDELRAGDNL